MSLSPRTYLLTVLATLGLVRSCWSQAQAGCGTPFAFTAERLTLPLTVVNDFVFVPTEVNGTKGKMMFDTGTRKALALNDRLLKQLGPGTAKGRGHVGSGQGYTVTIRDCVHGLKIGDGSAVDVPAVESEDLGFIEKDITPDFLGFLGYEAYPGYAFELDYVRRRLTLAKGRKGSRSSLVDGEKVLATLPFTTRRRPDDPFIAVKIGGHSFIGAFDTGQSGLLEMNDAMRDSMIKEGSLLPLPGKDEDGNAVYCVKDMKLAPGVHVSLPAMTIHQTGSLADKGTGITEPAAIFLGYQLLSQFKTVWDWPNQTIYLLQR
jgi:hypothetical protein